MARIFVVDDAAFMRKMLTDALLAGGHEIVGEAGDGVEALARFPELRPDLTTLDITMPEKDGIATLRELMTIEPDRARDHRLRARPRGEGARSDQARRPRLRRQALRRRAPARGGREGADLVLPASYTRAMAKVMVSLPDDLLDALDAEADRRHTSRSALLQDGARRELGLLRRDREDVLAELDALSGSWSGPVDAAALVRAERLRDG